MPVCPAAVPHRHPSPSPPRPEPSPPAELCEHPGLAGRTQWNGKRPLPRRGPDPRQGQRRPRASARRGPGGAATGAAPTVLLRGGSRVHCLRGCGGCGGGGPGGQRSAARLRLGLQRHRPRIRAARGGLCARRARAQCHCAPWRRREEHAVTPAARTTPPARPAPGGGRGRGLRGALSGAQGAQGQARRTDPDPLGAQLTAGPAPAPRSPQPKYFLRKDAPAASQLPALPLRSLLRLCVARPVPVGAGPRPLPHLEQLNAAKAGSWVRHYCLLYPQPPRHTGDWKEGDWVIPPPTKMLGD
uniref:Uncharacterized protein n=1 Tax=Sciurus vulgaris TaxID=55149 RepID=A0A8D2CJE3_SCIVU